MSTLSIVAISVFVCLFVLLLLIAAGAIVYLNLQLRRQMAETVKAFSDAQSGFQLTGRDIGLTLESHRSKMDVIIQKINGEELAAAAKLSASAAQRIERAAIAIGELARALVSEEALSESGIARAAASGLGPEDYAPATGERYASLNRTAAGDAEVLAEEFADNQN